MKWWAATCENKQKTSIGSYALFLQRKYSTISFIYSYSFATFLSEGHCQPLPSAGCATSNALMDNGQHIDSMMLFINIARNTFNDSIPTQGKPQYVERRTPARSCLHEIIARIYL